MIEWCAYCNLDTAGRHESNCPLNPDNKTLCLTKDEYKANWRNTPIMIFHSPKPQENRNERK